MAAKDTKTITAEISAHIKKQGGQMGSWYVGTASRVKPRLYGEHLVPKAKHWYIWRKAMSADDAAALEAAFHGLGCDGTEREKDDNARHVYAYLKTSATKP
ncbi:hypothetical protein [Thermomonas sp.]|uniref:hypothetical protein n=1 Tax=Thermomonas sp. TaxID=1971895 RepID=UPI00248A10F0|nr:hypothetical protein [Thermomonas sp.]MDI1253082.1 hypothetical protein [Thermomonas sp.]